MPSSPLAPPRARKPLLTRIAVVITGSALAAGTALATAPEASAAGITAQAATVTQSTTLSPRERYYQKVDRVLHVTSNQKGDPYRYGAAGPDAFDCSGLVYYVFRKALDRTLPRVANDQKRASKRIWHRRNLRPGDLVFQVDGSGYAYHVGIYAGHGYFWHAPHTGTVVKRQKMYPAHWRFGRIIKDY